MRNALVAFLVVFAVVVAAAPASAQHYGYDPYWGGINNIRRDMVGTPTAMIAQTLCDNHRGTGDLTEQSWCYGRKYNLDGSFAGYNPQSVALGYGQQYSNYGGYDDYGRRGRRNNRVLGDVAKVAAGALGGFVIGRVTAPKPKAEPRAEDTPATTYDPSDIELVINQTGCRARVNGAELAPGETIRVHTPTSKVSLQNASCSPAYKNLQQGIVALVCATK